MVRSRGKGFHGAQRVAGKKSGKVPLSTLAGAHRGSYSDQLFVWMRSFPSFSRDHMMQWFYLILWALCPMASFSPAHSRMAIGHFLVDAFLSSAGGNVPWSAVPYRGAGPQSASKMSHITPRWAQFGRGVRARPRSEETPQYRAFENPFVAMWPSPQERRCELPLGGGAPCGPIRAPL